MPSIIVIGLFALAQALVALSQMEQLNAAAGSQQSAAYTGDIFNCNNLCFKINDGICDDGGPGSVTGFCPYGSDCNDCGVRAPYTRAPTNRRTPQPTHAPGEVTAAPSLVPTHRPTTRAPTSKAPTSRAPTPKVEKNNPNNGRTPPKKTQKPTLAPTKKTSSPTREPTQIPTSAPSAAPSASPTMSPTFSPTNQPTFEPTASPTVTFKCGSITTKEKCCNPVQAAAGKCEFHGCIWSNSKRQCISLVTAKPTAKPTPSHGKGGRRLRE